MARAIDKVNSISVNKVSSGTQARFEYDSNDNCIYVGEAPRGSSVNDTTAWTLTKFTWVAGTVSGYNCTQKQVAYDSWTNRSTATYE